MEKTNTPSPKDVRTQMAEVEGAVGLIRIDKPVDPLTLMIALFNRSPEKALSFEKLPVVGAR